MNRIIVILAFVTMFSWMLPYIDRRFGDRADRLWRVKYLILGVYMLANAKETILFRTVQEEMSAKWLPFWSYLASVSWAEGFQVTDGYLLCEIILNILLFIPPGYLLPFTWPRVYAGRLGRVILACLMCSAFTESIQLFGRLGLFEFDDLINNAMGAMIGYGLYLTAYGRSGAPELLLRRRAAAGCVY